MRGASARGAAECSGGAWRCPSGWDRFEETKLPAKKEFFSKLSDSHIGDEEYTPFVTVDDNVILSCTS